MFAIYSKVGEFEPQKITCVKTEKAALTLIKKYEKQDKYEVSIGYGFPYGMPKYFIAEV